MAFFNKYPYTDFHELNLDWFLEQFKAIQKYAEDSMQQTITEYVNNNLTDIVMESSYDSVKRKLVMEVTKI